MKKIGLLVFMLLPAVVQSQEPIKLFLNAEWEITSKDKAQYVREAEYDLNNFKLNGKVSDYDVSGNLLMAGNYAQDKRNGNFIFYHENGDIKSEGAYERSKRAGLWKYYYKSGQLKQVVLFKESYLISDFSVLEFYDREGHQLIKNGSGKWENDSIRTGLWDRESLSTLTGEFLDSLKHGKWELTRISDKKVMHRERFNKGKLRGAQIYNALFDDYGTLSSEMLEKIPDENQKKFSATERFALDTLVFPETLLYADVETIFKTVTGKEVVVKFRNAGYRYGDTDLLRFIAENIRYPMEAIDSKASGKVYVNVTIDPQGNTREVSLLKGVHKALDQEALRVVRMVKDWLPALQDGQAVESTITIPVQFVIETPGH